MPFEVPMMRTAVDMVARCCRVARAVQQDVEEIRRETKDDRSPVTVADFAVQAIVALTLLEDDPDALIVGEEKADLLRQSDMTALRDEVVKAVRTVRPDATAERILDAIDHCRHDGNAEAFWTIDPVDGTKGFLRGQQYAVALGRIERGHVVLGVMGCPNLPRAFDASLEKADPRGAIYFAASTRGAWELPADKPGAEPTRIGAREVDPEDLDGIRACESVEAAHSAQDDTARVLASLGSPGKPVRLDSQCKYAVVARGQADAYLRLPTRKDYVEKIWDHAAGSLIATEAGARVSDITGSALDFGRGRRLETNRGIVCAAYGLHGLLIDAIEKLGIAQPAR